MPDFGQVLYEKYRMETYMTHPNAKGLMFSNWLKAWDLLSEAEKLGWRRTANTFAEWLQQ